MSLLDFSLDDHINTLIDIYYATHDYADWLLHFVSDDDKLHLLKWTESQCSKYSENHQHDPIPEFSIGNIEVRDLGLELERFYTLFNWSTKDVDRDLASALDSVDAYTYTHWDLAEDGGISSNDAATTVSTLHKSAKAIAAYVIHCMAEDVFNTDVNGSVLNTKTCRARSRREMHLKWLELKKGNPDLSNQQLANLANSKYGLAITRDAIRHALKRLNADNSNGD